RSSAATADADSGTVRFDFADFGAFTTRSRCTLAADARTVTDAGSVSLTSPHRSARASPCRSPVFSATTHRAPFGHVSHRARIRSVSAADGGSGLGRADAGGVTLLTGLRGRRPRFTASL